MAPRLFYTTATAGSGESRGQWMTRLDGATRLSISEKTIRSGGEAYETAEFLKGYATTEEVTPLLSQYNITFEYSSFAVVAINITVIGAVGHGTVKDAIFIVDNMTADCLGDAMHLTRIDADGRLFYIVNTPDDVDIKQEIISVFSRVAGFAQKEIGLWFSVSMSSVSKELADVPTLYREALLAMDYGTFYGVDDYFFMTR